MKNNFLFLSLLLSLLVACTKTDTGNSNNNGNTIVTIDSSEFNGRLFVETYDYTLGTKISGADVFLYTNYEDINRGIYLFYQKGNSSGEADFGYLLQGNYYLVSKTFFKADTSLVQVLSKRTIHRNVYLR